MGKLLRFAWMPVKFFHFDKFTHNIGTRNSQYLHILCVAVNMKTIDKISDKQQNNSLKLNVNHIRESDLDRNELTGYNDSKFFARMGVSSNMATNG